MIDEELLIHDFADGPKYAGSVRSAAREAASAFAYVYSRHGLGAGAAAYTGRCGPRRLGFFADEALLHGIGFFFAPARRSLGGQREWPRVTLFADRSSKPSLLAIVVLYKMRLEDSVALRTLRDAGRVPNAPLPLQILVYDNSPGMQIGEIPQDLLYIRSEQNRGLSAAYNEATRMARKIHADWLLTLDQDTTIPADFLSKLVPILQRIAGDARVAAVVPRLREGERTLSPHWFAFDFFRRLFPTTFSGVPERSVYAFNSGSTFRVTALEQIGGYNELFWLDYSDAYLFRQFHFHRFRMFVAGDLVLQHELSLLDASTRMSDARFQNILEAGSAFFDMMRGPLSGVAFTAGLVKSYVGSLVRHRPPTHRQVLVAMLKLRLFHRKAYRMRRFEEQCTGQDRLATRVV